MKTTAFLNISNHFPITTFSLPNTPQKPVGFIFPFKTIVSDGEILLPFLYSRVTRETLEKGSKTWNTTK